MSQITKLLCNVGHEVASLQLITINKHTLKHKIIKICFTLCKIW